MRCLTAISLVVLGPILSGCVTYVVHNEAHNDRELVKTSLASVEVTSKEISDGMLRLNIRHSSEKTFQETTSVTLQQEYKYDVWTGEAVKDYSLFGLLALPFDLVRFTLSAPVMYPAGAIAAIDPSPTSSLVTEWASGDLPAGTEVAVTVGEDGRQETVQLGEHGSAVVGVAADVERALAAGGKSLRLAVDVSGASPMTSEVRLSLREMVNALKGNDVGPDERRARWQRIHDACPESASATRAAVENELRALAFDGR